MADVCSRFIGTDWEGPGKLKKLAFSVLAAIVSGAVVVLKV